MTVYSFCVLLIAFVCCAAISAVDGFLSFYGIDSLQGRVSELKKKKTTQENSVKYEGIIL